MQFLCEMRDKVSEEIKMIIEVVLAILGIGLVFKILKFKFLRNNFAIGKNVDNSRAEPGATVIKNIGDNSTINIGIDEDKVEEKIENATKYRPEEIVSEVEPENQKEGDYWVFPY